MQPRNRSWLGLAPQAGVGPGDAPAALLLAGVLSGLLCASCAATAPPAAAPAVQQRPALANPTKPAQEPPREADEYTRYELLAPGSGRFHILFEVTATYPGAAVYLNPIRRGSTASGERVLDQATGKPLPFEVVSGEAARRSGSPEAEAGTDYIRVHLPHPVPAEGGVRLLIEKTYEDPQSYLRLGEDRIVFARSLGIRRNAVVLPSGYELTGCNVPAQVRTETDGRLTVSFVHTGPEALPVRIEARRLTP
ncbi:MAG TPA: hypothetical protein VMM92_08850 [Thermoanaerobaculia bacterium]|nr:hypothetical protein [Thermoanaerobaculia bacterium]